ncbi:MAG: hypothetical protein QXZ70_00950 [Candidatus Bathyarchaeia archaeon]
MKENYQEKILALLSKAVQPIDVEKIRVACGIGNWNTALTHCLELLVQGKIQGQKTSKGWTFWIYHETQLEPWEEAIGNYEALKISEDKVTLILTHTIKNLAIAFQKETPEAQILIQTLKNTKKGTKLAILKTDNQKKPIIVRPYNETPIANKPSSTLFQFRKSMLWIAFKLTVLKFTLWLFGLRLGWWF